MGCKRSAWAMGEENRSDEVEFGNAGKTFLGKISISAGSEHPDWSNDDSWRSDRGEIEGKFKIGKMEIG
jgi:hypothetical protein